MEVKRWNVGKRKQYGPCCTHRGAGKKTVRTQAEWMRAGCGAARWTGFNQKQRWWQKHAIISIGLFIYLNGMINFRTNVQMCTEHIAKPSIYIQAQASIDTSEMRMPLPMRVWCARVDGSATIASVQKRTAPCTSIVYDKIHATKPSSSVLYTQNVEHIPLCQSTALSILFSNLKIWCVWGIGPEHSGK